MRHGPIRQFRFARDGLVKEFMNLAICPHCAGQLQAVDSSTIVTLSCPACGWNCVSARHVWIRHRWAGRLFLLLGLVSVLAIPLVPEFSDAAPIIAAACFIVGGVTYWTARSSLRELPDKTYRPSGGPAREFTKLIPSRQEVETRFPGVLDAARPRHVQWTWRTWAWPVLILIWMMFVASQWDKGGLEWTDLLGVLAVFCAVFGKLEVQTYREWKLFILGESTPGRVICQRPVSDGRYSSSIIFYAFEDASNRPFVGEARDSAMTIKEGDPLVVFYRLSDPNRNVVLDGYDFTIVAP
jgi:hypothetical protein